jgi:DNA-directed RNA polymerase specialized sigma24 family protein
MINVTIEQIRTAMGNDIESASALAHILSEFDERVIYLARRAATSSGRVNHTLAEDLAQEGRTAIWTSLPNFKGDSVAQFFTFVDTTVTGVISSARKVETRPGVALATAQRFEAAVSIAKGDAYAAEQIVQDADVMGGKFRTLSADLAYAARLSYQGLDYLDAPAGGSDDSEPTTVGANIASTIGIPEDMLTADDYSRAARKQTTTQVHDTLNKMGDQQRTVLMALTGIDPVAEYGVDFDDELSADYGIQRDRVKVVRSKGKTRFAALYSEAYAI